MKNYALVKSLTVDIKNWDKIIYSLIAIGIFLRFFHFFQDRSMWMDEMFLSVNLIKMTFWELATVPLEYQQKAPIGFLWLVKLSVTLFGADDKAVRLIPLICGVASLFFFLTVSKKHLSPMGVAVAVGILSLSPHLIYHSVEAKQYSTEVLCSILVLHFYNHYYGKADARSLISWGLIGGLILWFSFSSIFVLAGMAFGLSLYHLIKKDRRAFFLYIIPFSIWLLSFVINYALFTNKHTDSEWLIEWFRYREGFVPHSLKGSLLWLTKKVFTLLNFPLGLSWFPLPDQYHHMVMLLIVVRMSIFHLILLILGAILSARKDFKIFSILAFPLLLHLFAATLSVYPFYERLTVYLAPLLIMQIAFGCQGVLTLFTKKWIFLRRNKAPEYPPQAYVKIS